MPLFNSILDIDPKYFVGSFKILWPSSKSKQAGKQKIHSFLTFLPQNSYNSSDSMQCNPKYSSWPAISCVICFLPKHHLLRHAYVNISSGMIDPMNTLKSSVESCGSIRHLSLLCCPQWTLLHVIINTRYNFSLEKS